LGDDTGQVAVRIDEPDGDDAPVHAPDLPDATATAGADGTRDRPESPDADAAREARIARALDHRATVDAAYRAYAIDQAYEKISEIERGTVTPAIKRIEAADPDRHLAGLENRLKGKDRLTEKVIQAVEERGHTVESALGMIKDATRYTFVYREDRYTEGVYADCERLEAAGFERVDRKDSWDCQEYKGINSRWRVPGTSQLFEVQFHTQASLDAKEETHWAYERLRMPSEDDTEISQLTAKVPVPPGALDIPDYP
jgi:hypothetical protein